MYQRLMRVLGLVLTLSLGGAGAAARTLTADEKQLHLDSFDIVWQTIHDTYWDASFAGMDWPAIRDELRPEMTAASTRSQARSVLRKMLSRLGQSHFDILPARVYDTLHTSGEDDAHSGSGGVGLELRVIDGAAVVTAVEPGSAAGRAGVRPGWILVSAGDADLVKLVNDSAPAAHGGIGDALLQHVVLEEHLRGRIGETLSVVLLDAQDREVSLNLALTSDRGKKVRLGYLPEMSVWFESRLVDGVAGYIAFNLFLDPAMIMTRFGEAVESFMEADGIVVDLRGNPGGIGGMAMGTAGFFVADKGRRLGTMVTRETELAFVVFPRPQVYRGPVAVLVDELSGSTAEILAGGLKDMGRARVFGTTTAGMALPSRIERLPNGDGFQYAIANYVSAGGAALEGRGVTPDVKVRLTRAALIEGRDPVLDAALEWIAAQNAHSSAATGG